MMVWLHSGSVFTCPVDVTALYKLLLLCQSQEYFLSADSLWRSSALTVAAAAGHGEGLKLAILWNHGVGFCLRRPMEKLYGKPHITLRSQTEAEASINRTVLNSKTEGEERFTFRERTQPARAMRYTFAF